MDILKTEHSPTPLRVGQKFSPTLKILITQFRRKGLQHMYDYLQPLDTMQRINREELAERLDELLEIVSRDNVGFVITDKGKDDLVLCPANWFNVYYDDDFGCIINSAVRYSLGRSSYMPSTTVRFVLRNLMVLDTRTIVVMIKDIERELVDEQLPYRDIWISLKIALEDRLQKMNNESVKDND